MYKWISVIAALLFTTTTMAQQDPIEGQWFTEDKSAKIKIYKAKNDKFYGKIVWLKEPNREDGKPKLDDKNPDKSKHSDPILGILLLKGFEKDGANDYEDGTVYDPKNGKTYACEMNLSGDVLNVRGFVGISLLGRTTKWTRVE